MKWFRLLVIFTLFLQPGFAEAKQSSGLRMDLWRYHGQTEDFTAAQHHLLFESDGLFHGFLSGYVDGLSYIDSNPNLAALSNLVGPWLEGRNRCKSHLDTNQEFALQIMRRRHAITVEEFNIQIGIGRQLKPDQVTFIEISNWALEGDTESRSSLQFAEDFEKPQGWFKRSSLWVLGGQTIRNGFKHYRLPLQGNESSPWKVEINRKKFKYIWELGRAAQIEPAMIQHNLRAGVLVAFNELRYLGGDLRDAFIFVHSLDEIHTQLYVSRYGMKIHAKNPERPGEAVLVMNLAVALNNFPPETWLEPIQESLQATGSLQLHGKDFLPLRDSARQLDLVTIDLKAAFGNTHNFGITVRDFSNLHVGLIAAQVFQLGILNPSTAREVAGAITRSIGTEHRPRDLPDPGEAPAPQVTIFEDLPELLRRHNALEITDLDADQMSDVRYPLGVVLSVYHFELDRLKKMGISDPENFFRERKAELAIVTSNPRVIEAMKEPSFKGTLISTRPRLVTMPTFFKLSRVIQYEQNIVAYFFDTQKIEALQVKYPNLNQQAKRAARPGYWQFRAQLEHPRQF